MTPLVAKIAKRVWVEKVKIKSKWKIEKRKLLAGSSALVSSSKLEAGEASGDDEDQHDVVVDQDDATYSANSGDVVPPKAQLSASDRNAGGHGRAREKGRGKPSEHTSNPQRRPPRRAASSSSRLAGGEQKQKSDNSQPVQGEDEVALRELFRKAYSRESLHTYKSDPLHRGKGRPTLHRGGTERTGRGQPDMRLRMNALLEKIKRDVAPH